MRDTSSFLVVWLDPGITFILPTAEGFPGGSYGKASVYNAGDLSSVPESRRSPGEGSGNPL